MKLSEIAKKFDGQLINFTEDIEIKSLKGLENASEGDLTFVASDKYFQKATDSNASAFLVPEEIKELNKPQIIVKNPDVVFYKLIEIIYPTEEPEPVISEKSSIGKNVKIGKNVYIGDFAVIEDNTQIGDNVKIYPSVYVGRDSSIGDNSILYANCSIYPKTEIGKNVIIHSGAVIGADGFGYYFHEGKHNKIKHIGKVVLEDNVEIGANATVDRSMLDVTRIGNGTKIDNLVHVAHNCQVGEHSIFAGQVGIAGSTKIGNYVILAGQVGVADHIEIGDQVTVTAKSGVTGNLAPGKMYGNTMPAVEWKKWKKILVYIMKLPELAKKLK